MRDRALFSEPSLLFVPGVPKRGRSPVLPAVDSIDDACRKGLCVTVSVTIAGCPRAEVHGGVEVAEERCREQVFRLTSGSELFVQLFRLPCSVPLSLSLAVGI